MSRSILTVVTAPESRLLSTVGRVKDALGITVTTYDDFLGQKLAETSAAAATYCNRSFGYQVVSETFRLRHCRDSLLLRGRDKVEIVSVTVDGTALEEEDWEVDPEAGLLYRLSSDHRCDWPRGKIVVQYSYGWILPSYDDFDEDESDFPEDIESAVFVQVKSDYFSKTRDPLLKGVNLPNVGERQYWVGSVGSAGAAAALLPEAAAKLGKYVNHAVA